MIWSKLILDLVKIPITVYENRYSIQHWWAKLMAYTNLGSTEVVVLGRPAVGKSLLCANLYGEASSFNFKIPGTSRDVETKAIQLGDWTKIVRVMPGQSSQERSKGLEEAFHSGHGIEGIIYVVDWGYTDVRDLTSKQTLIKEKGIDTIEKLRDYNLKNELDDLKITLEKIKELYGTKRGPKWVIIAVNKVDLYYEQIDDAQNYYSLNTSSPFSKSLSETINQLGSQNIKCVSLPISSWQSDLDWNGVLIKTSIGGKEIEHGLSRNFVSQIAEMSK